MPYLPGFIYFAAGRRVYVGQSAKKYYHLKPHRVVRSVKRGLDRVFSVGRNAYTGADLARLIMLRLLRECREQTGEIVRECVLTVPSTFGHRERETLREALLKTSRSIKKVHLLDEPLAAFISHANDSDSFKGMASDRSYRENVMLVDMGGGTTDLALLRLEGTGKALKVNPLAVWSHLQLGGDDFDRLIAMDIALKRVEEGLIPYERLTESERKFLWGNFLVAAEDLKLRLGSARGEVRVEAGGLQGEKPLGYCMDEALQRRITKPLTDALIECIRYVLARGNVAREDLGRIILTGGMSRARIIQRAVQDFFQRETEMSGEPQSAVARGACYYHASVLNPDREDIDTLKPVLTKALFLRMSKRRMVKVLPSCLGLPAGRQLSHQFVSPVASCNALRIPFYQGNDDGSEIRPLVTLTLAGGKRLPPGLPVIIDVKVDENKMISVSARAGRDGDRGEAEGLHNSARVWGL